MSVLRQLADAPDPVQQAVVRGAGRALVAEELERLQAERRRLGYTRAVLLALITANLVSQAVLGLVLLEVIP